MQILHLREFQRTFLGQLYAMVVLGLIKFSGLLRVLVFPPLSVLDSCLLPLPLIILLY